MAEFEKIVYALFNMKKDINSRTILTLGLILVFLVNTFGHLPLAQAQPASPVGGDFFLPAPGVMVHLSTEFNPPVLKGIKVHPDNPFRFDFILDKGDMPTGALRTEATRLIKYFLSKSV